MVEIEGVIENGALVKGAAKKLFGGKFDQHSWLTWLPDDGRELCFKRRYNDQQNCILLVRYGNKNVVVWKIECPEGGHTGVLTPKRVFIPAIKGFGKNMNIPIASAYSEVVLGNAEASSIMEFVTLPPRLVGFRDRDLLDVADLDQKKLAGAAKSNDPEKMERFYKNLSSANRINGLVFVPDVILPEDFVSGYDQPWVLDMVDYYDEDGLPVPQVAKQTALTSLNLHYGAIFKVS